jgi:hypothetical protein
MTLSAQKSANPSNTEPVERAKQVTKDPLEQLDFPIPDASMAVVTGVSSC